jgi:hypothetical protein
MVRRANRGETRGAEEEKGQQARRKSEIDYEEDAPAKADTLFHTVDLCRKSGSLPAVEGCRLRESLLERTIVDARSSPFLCS